MEPPHPTDDTDVSLIVAYHSNDIILMMILTYHDTPVMILIRQLQWWCWYDGSRRLTFPEFTNSGYFSRTRFSCSHMVVKTLLYCTRKCGCKDGCKSARCFWQPPCNGSHSFTRFLPVLHPLQGGVVKSISRKRNRCNNKNEWYNILINFIFKFS